MSIIIGIGGVSRAGKTTMAKTLKKRYGGLKVAILHQDDFVFTTDLIPKVRDRTDWESPDSIDFNAIIEKIEILKKENAIIIIEGIFAFYNNKLNKLYNRRIYLTIDKDTFLDRKALDHRWGREPQWYIHHIWDSHIIHNNIPNLDESYLLINATKYISFEYLDKYIGIWELV